MKKRKSAIATGDEGEPLEKCLKCLTFYSPEYAKATGGHECNKFNRELVKRGKR